MASLDDLQELDDTQIFKRYIKNFILQNSDLQKIIYYPVKNPLLKDDLENPYDLFDSTTAMSADGTGIHGVVLFRRKCDEIINAEVPIILIDFQSAKAGNSEILGDLYIIIRVIMKGTNIQELENGLSRSSVIAELFDKNINSEKVNSIGKVIRESYNPLPINEENSGYMGIYKARVISNRLLEEANK